MPPSSVPKNKPIKQPGTTSVDVAIDSEDDKALLRVAGEFVPDCTTSNSGFELNLAIPVAQAVSTLYNSTGELLFPWKFYPPSDDWLL